MKKLIAILLIIAVFLSGCVGQPSVVEKPTTTTKAEVVEESQEFTHDLDQAIEDLSELG